MYMYMYTCMYYIVQGFTLVLEEGAGKLCVCVFVCMCWGERVGKCTSNMYMYICIPYMYMYIQLICVHVCTCNAYVYTFERLLSPPN